MKRLTLLSVSIVLLTNLIYSQSVEIKDSAAETLIIVNDEGTDKSSLTLPSSPSAPTITDNKLFNEGGALMWNGITLTTGSSLWTESSGDIYRGSGNVGIGHSTPDPSKLSVNGDIKIWGDLYFGQSNRYLKDNAGNYFEFSHSLFISEADDFPVHLYSDYHPWDTKMNHHIKLEVANGWWTIGIDDQADDADLLFRSNEDSDGYTALIDPTNGGWIITSDKRLKKNIEPLSNMLDKIQQLEPVSFHRLTQDDNEQRELGFLAQDVNKIFPNSNIAKLKSDYWTLTYDNFGTIAIAGIKELKDEKDKEIQELNIYIAELVARIEKLESQTD